MGTDNKDMEHERPSKKEVRLVLLRISIKSPSTYSPSIFPLVRDSFVMPLSHPLIASCEGNLFFTTETLLLLASILLSFCQYNSNLFYGCTGACLFTTIATMVFELSHGWTAGTITAGTTKTTLLSGMLLATFVASLASGSKAFVVRTHLTVASALCACWGIEGCVGRVDSKMETDRQVQVRYSQAE